ncbi:hypothetical protein ACO1KQ_14645, partial [Staphylococcus aureus]
LYSVGRQDLNTKLLDELDRLSHVKLYFKHTLIDVSSFDGKCQFMNNEGNIVNYQFDFIIGADGAYSATREIIAKKARISLSRQYISHG